MKRFLCLVVGVCLLAVTSVPAAAQSSLKWEQPPNCVDGFKTLSEGESVEFEVAPGKKGEQAVNVIRSRS